MIYHGLVCMLSDRQALPTQARTLRLNQAPSMSKMREVYTNNLDHLRNLVGYCGEHNIKAFRVSCDLFPLATHPDYSLKAKRIIDSLGDKFSEINKYCWDNNIELSCHPDQFIVLSSEREEVNKAGVRELRYWGWIANRLDLRLINIHVGAKARGHAWHLDMFKRNLDRLSDKARSLLSVENDEKCYSAEQVLRLAQSENLMAILDFHHHRVHSLMHRRSSSDWFLLDFDRVAYSLIPDFVATYKDRECRPWFHISSPKCDDWHTSMPIKLCPHADTIHVRDIPWGLYRWAKNNRVRCNLDVEAKLKERAVLKLRKVVNGAKSYL